ncbi:MAG TPA: TetR/AcrR family transcriptional regulator C-terminal domain-containing protein [Burkholderiales bacterium]|jgi:AcrR family transcriptional regulator
MAPRKKPRDKRRRESLSPERIVDAALVLVERDGLGAFSTRKLGQELGCEAMSIYHHFPSKAHLLDALVDRVINDLGLPPPKLDPIERMRLVAYAYRAMAHRYPKLFQLIGLHRMNSAAGLQCLNGIIQTFRDAGFDAESAARLFRAFSYYIVGAALDETAGYAKGTSSQTPVPEDEVRLRFPRVAEAGPYFKPQHFDATFAAGLEILLDGIRRIRDSRPT